MAFVLYYLDCRYDLNEVLSGVMTRVLSLLKLDNKDFIYTMRVRRGWLVLATLLIVSFILALKSAESKRKRKSSEQYSEVSESESVEDID